jgi:hypothetical protein
MARGAVEKFKLTPAGARALLRSPGVRDDLEARAERIKAAAQPYTDNDLIADSYIGKGRAGATVIGVPMRQERDERILGSAIDAARGG